MEKVEACEVVKEEVKEEVERFCSQMSTPKKRKSKAQEDTLEKPKKPR